MKLLNAGRVSVASQLLQLLVDILLETHTVETDEWVSRIIERHTAHQNAIEKSTTMKAEESFCLQLLQKS